jgi:hypothetical protein
VYLDIGYKLLTWRRPRRVKLSQAENKTYFAEFFKKLDGDIAENQANGPCDYIIECDSEFSLGNGEICQTEFQKYHDGKRKTGGETNGRRGLSGYSRMAPYLRRISSLVIFSGMPFGIRTFRPQRIKTS